MREPSRIRRASRQLGLATVLGLGLLVAGCGGGDEEPAPAPASEVEPADAGADAPTSADAVAAGDAAGSETTGSGDDDGAEPASENASGGESESQGADAPGADEAGDDEAGDDEAGDALAGDYDPLLSGYARLAEQPAWRIRQQIVSSGAGEMTQLLEYQKPDRFRMTMEDMQVVMVDRQVWIQAGEQWISSPGMETMIDGMLDQVPGAGGSNESMAALQAVEDLGTEAVDGEPARKVRYAIEAPEGGQIEVTVWFREADGLPLRQVMQSSFGEFDAEITADFEYDDRIVIEAPQR